ncbi:MAG: hypothetical protein ACI4V7_04385 [Succinivibrionaceae bacterium]
MIQIESNENINPINSKLSSILELNILMKCDFVGTPKFNVIGNIKLIIANKKNAT